MKNIFRKFAESKFQELATLSYTEFDDFDKIVSKKGFDVYRDLKYDEQIKFCLTIKKFLILSSGYEITPANDSTQAVEQRDFVENNFQNMDKSFSNVLYQFMSALDYGFSAAELLWKKKEEKIVLKDIKIKLPWDVNFEYDDYGNLTKLLINSEEMPMNKFVIYSFMEQFGDKKGESDLKAAYNAWWFKNNVWKFWARHLERFGSPIVKGHIPPGVSEKETDKFHAIINRLHNIVGVILPRAKTGEEFDFELVESKREGGAQFVEALENVDGRIARALLLPRLIGATKESFGSYALGYEQFRMFYKLFIFISDNFSEEVINRQVIKRLIDYNYTEPLYPKFKILELKEEAVKEMIEKLDYPGFPSDKNNEKK